jgi:hypothetical protein
MRVFSRHLGAAVVVVVTLLAGAAPAHADVVAAPSASAAMICAPEATAEIAQSIGVEPVQLPAPTWSNDTYSCSYDYANGTMVLSVKELATRAGAVTYFRSLARTLGSKSNVRGLGQGAFVTRNRSVVVRKDALVLLVDVSRLPTRFGAVRAGTRPPARGVVALDVAGVIMGCWTGG